MSEAPDLVVTFHVGEADEHGQRVVSGADRIAVERARQKLVEGYSAENDRGRTDELALAASCYAIPARLGGDTRSRLWPWDRRFWKPGLRSSRDAGERIRELEKAGALIAAAIDDILARGER